MDTSIIHLSVVIVDLVFLENFVSFLILVCQTLVFLIKCVSFYHPYHIFVFVKTVLLDRFVKYRIVVSTLTHWFASCLEKIASINIFSISQFFLTVEKHAINVSKTGFFILIYYKYIFLKVRQVCWICALILCLLVSACLCWEMINVIFFVSFILFYVQKHVHTAYFNISFTEIF